MSIRNTINNVFKALLISFIVAFLVALLTGLIVNQRFASIKLDEEKLKIEPKPTRIYDASGNKMAEFERDRKEMTPYSEIPTEVVEAIVSTEDREFFNHSGMNIRAVFRALLIDIRSGSFEQGGSTITQQLVKRIYLNPGKTLDRKLQEAVYSAAIEKEYSKQEILAYYLNHIYYGERAYGIKNAIETYFGQSLDEFKSQDRIDLIAKSALIAGIPNAPSLMDPYLNKDQALQRRNTVLTNMYVEGYITREEYEAAKKKDFLTLGKPKVAESEKINYPEYVTYVLSEASEKLNLPVEDVMYSGLTLYTSFEPDIYKSMRKHMSNSKLYPSNPAGDRAKVEGASVFLNPQNGEIYALSGSREEVKTFLTFNRAYQAKRGPGSAFKPLIDYGPALETGKYSPYSTVHCTGNFGWVVKDHGCGGSKTMAEALRVSNNGPAVWMLQKVGIQYARDYVAKLGIELDDSDVYLPIALGGLKYGVTPLELADAYQAFANGGKRAEAHTIRRIVNHIDEIIYEPDKPVQVISEKAAGQMKSMLRSVVTNGTGSNANVPGYYIAGKTGTNENASGRGNKDIWFVGFTSNLVGVVWQGFDNTDSGHYIPSGQTSYIAAKMFGKIAKDALGILPKVSQSEEKVKTETKKISLVLYRNTEGNQVTIKWDDKSGLKYEVYRNNKIIGDSLDGAYTDNDVEPEQTYTYKVIGYDEKTGEKVVESSESSIKLPKVVKKDEEKTNDPNDTGEPNDSGDNTGDNKEKTTEDNTNKEKNNNGENKQNQDDSPPNSEKEETKNDNKNTDKNSSSTNNEQDSDDEKNNQ
ncbi:transglycosylase domain-containing protein [Bacillus mexicanus]|uniref:transglycosylase domain-containing protein n=1 Tax=Bacillus mexicanus TaxID=2834415 RepID=UPI003D22352E